MFQITQTPEAPAALGPYTKGIKAGDYIFCSGQLGITPEGETVEGFEGQSRQIFSNLKAVLEDLGGNLGQTVNIRVFCKNKADFPALNDIFKEFLSEPFPTRSTIFVDLPGDFLVEMDLVAYVGPR